MALKKKKKKTTKRAVKKASKKVIKKTVKRKPVRKVSKPKAVKRKSTKKKLAKKKPIQKKAFTGIPKEDIIGVITHYFPKVRAAVVKLKVPLSVGQTVKIKGHTTDFTQSITSMQLDHAPLTVAKKGQEIGLQVNSRVRQHDLVVKP